MFRAAVFVASVAVLGVAALVPPGALPTPDPTGFHAPEGSCKGVAYVPVTFSISQAPAAVRWVEFRASRFAPLSDFSCLGPPGQVSIHTWPDGYGTGEIPRQVYSQIDIVLADRNVRLAVELDATDEMTSHMSWGLSLDAPIRGTSGGHNLVIAANTTVWGAPLDDTSGYLPERYLDQSNHTIEIPVRTDWNRGLDAYFEVRPRNAVVEDWESVGSLASTVHVRVVAPNGTVTETLDLQTPFDQGHVETGPLTQGIWRLVVQGDRAADPGAWDLGYSGSYVLRY